VSGDALNASQLDALNMYQLGDWSELGLAPLWCELHDPVQASAAARNGSVAASSLKARYGGGLVRPSHFPPDGHSVTMSFNDGTVNGRRAAVTFICPMCSFGEAAGSHAAVGHLLAVKAAADNDLAASNSTAAPIAVAVTAESGPADQSADAASPVDNAVASASNSGAAEDAWLSSLISVFMSAEAQAANGSNAAAPMTLDGMQAEALQVIGRAFDTARRRGGDSTIPAWALAELASSWATRLNIPLLAAPASNPQAAASNRSTARKHTAWEVAVVVLAAAAAVSTLAMISCLLVHSCRARVAAGDRTIKRKFSDFPAAAVDTAARASCEV